MNNSRNDNMSTSTKLEYLSAMNVQALSILHTAPIYVINEFLDINNMRKEKLHTAISKVAINQAQSLLDELEKVKIEQLKPKRTRTKKNSE